MSKNESLQWWQKDIIYQVYPRSFKDDNKDGIGDLPGIISKLDYLSWLGVGAIWISPVYPSPMADFGYDISDYTAIHPMFGSMDDFERLVEKAHEMNIRVIMDLVPNHTSDQHEWFMESRSSRDNPKRDWYIWKDPAPDGGPPNNWISEFGGSAWEYDDHTGQYFYHTFLKEQPELNWRNPEVQEAMFDVMRFWFDKGVDGYRIDVLWYLIKDKFFRDDPPNPHWHEGMSEHDKHIPAFSSDQPDVHEIVAMMRKVSDEYKDRVLIGEIYLPIDQLVVYYGQDGKQGVHLPFNFHLVLSEWDAAEIYKLISEYEAALPDTGWPNWVLGNHDKFRIRTRAGEDQLKVAAIMLLTLRGTPTMYYGDEIGMKDVDIPEDRIQDPKEIRQPGIGLGRDPERTPMQWTAGEQAGFSEAEPWLPVADDFHKVNVESQQKDPDSLLMLYQRLIRLRQSEPALYLGEYFPEGLNGQLMAYKRKFRDREFLVCLNLGDKDETFTLKYEMEGTVVIASNIHDEGRILRKEFIVRANEGLVIKIS